MTNDDGFEERTVNRQTVEEVVDILAKNQQTLDRHLADAHAAGIAASRGCRFVQLLRENIAHGWEAVAKMERELQERAIHVSRN